MGRVQKHAGGPPGVRGGCSSEIVGDCELDDMAGKVRRRMWAKVFFTCLFV